MEKHKIGKKMFYFFVNVIFGSLPQCCPSSDATPLALPHYDTCDVSVIADLSGQWHIALS